MNEENLSPSQLELEDVACLAIAITLWLAKTVDGDTNEDVLKDIGAIADAIRGETSEED